MSYLLSWLSGRDDDGIVCTVNRDSFNEEIGSSKRKIRSMGLLLLTFVMITSIQSVINRPLPYSPTINVRVDYGHSVRGQGSRLIGADRGRISHRFTGVQMTNEVIIEHHLNEGYNEYVLQLGRLPF